MNSKKVNWIFLSIVLLHFALVAVITVLGLKYGYTLGIVPNFLVSQGILLAPALLWTLFSGENLFRLVGLNRIKVSTVFKICLFTFLAMPLTTLINMISMLFVDNTVAAISGDVLDAPFLVMLFIIGIFGPFSEELVFRGIVYQGYRKSGTVFYAMLLSALLFSLMHMNFNQAAYAFVIGVMVALLVEATGSLWSSVIFHMVFNSQQVCLMYLYDAVSFGENELEQAQEMLTKDVLLIMISLWLMFAAAATALAACALVWIAKGEGRGDALKAVWRDRKKQVMPQAAQTAYGMPETAGMYGMAGSGQGNAAEACQWPEAAGEKKENAKTGRMVTVPLIIGIVLALSYMSLELILEHLLFSVF